MNSYRNYVLTLFLFAMAIINSMAAINKTSLDIKVMSFNIRTSFGNDGANNWDNRKDLVLRSLSAENPDLIGMQEVTSKQYLFLKENLKGYNSYAVGRKDGKLEDEIMAIFYKPTFEVLLDSTVWLSETPTVIGSKSWDAALYRTVSWIKIKEKTSGNIFLFFNTHFDHMGVEARANSARLIAKLIKENSNGLQVILVGDFNTTSQEDPYKILTEKWQGYIQLNDARLTTEKEHQGGESTFNGYKEGTGKIIDFIFVSDGIKVKEHQYLNIREGELYISDHYPVQAVVTITNKKVRLNSSGKVMD